MMVKPLIRCARCSLSAALAFAIPTFAQESPPPEQSDKRSKVLEEVVVTATKRARSVRDIPTSIDAFTGNQLEARGATTIEEIVKYSPGVTLEGGVTRADSTVQMRGISNNARTRGPRAIGRFYDNVPLVNPSLIGFQPNIDPFDMETVEILKGPQGTLFGGAALAGAVRFVPNKPDFEEFYGSASYGLGSAASSDEKTEEYTLMFNLPLHDSVAVRLAGSVRDLGGYLDNTRSGEDDVNDYLMEQWRGILAWRPADNLTMRVNYFSSESESDSFDLVYERTGEPHGGRNFNEKFLDDFGLTESEIYGWELSWDLPDFSFVLESNQLEKSMQQQVAGTFIVGLEDTSARVKQEVPRETEQTTHEFRIVSNELTGGWWPFQNWEYVAGLFYMKSDQDSVTRTMAFSTTPDPFGDLPDALREQFESGTQETLHNLAFALSRETALYFNLTRLFAARWELNLGGRWFDQVTDGRTVSFVTKEGNVGLIPPADVAEFGTSLEEEGFNPKGALTWHASDNISFIASIAEGFRFGGVNEIGPGDALNIPPTFKSDEIVNYELGVRTTWLGRRITADVMAFKINWNDMQIQQRDPSTGIFTFIQNIGKSKVDGVEFAVNTILPAGFSITVSGAHVDSQTATGFESNQHGHIESGTRLPQAPRWTGSATLQYGDQWFGWDVNGSLSYSYRGHAKNDIINTRPLDGFGTVGMSLSVGNTALPFEPKVSLIGTNLTDVNEAVFSFTTGNGNDIVTLTTPRQVLMKLEIRF